MVAEWEGADEAYALSLQKNEFISRDAFMGELTESEKFWVGLQPFLLMRGYKLRPRYQPDWTPSWLKPKRIGRDIYSFEDALSLPRPGLIDATRQCDGTKVVIKCIDTSTEELPIYRYLASPELMANPRNRTAPLLDVVLLPNDDSQVLIVMPQLLQFNQVPFRRVGEVFEAFHQLLQGLEFMHDLNVSHRDACYFNLMMDASKVVPRGFHFAQRMTNDGVSLTFRWRARWSVRPVPYHFIDFGISRRYPTGLKDVKDTTRLGQDRSAPEYARPEPYDPFKADVYQLGNVFLKVIEPYDPDGLGVFLALGKAMTSPDPDDRPSPAAALQMLDGMDKRLFKRRIWRPWRTWSEKFEISFCGVNSLV
ncbi:hypothetical protein D9615_006630 [Tricholomella constricta]|uniref:Protein kinase domain-containing protein n=1 Tax=Tricholomella constricta TaxID=117010 RepID=A0A8H5HA77_9AGAR|nr:hypothetical protein D9615_006630 [Tricholomella constricta]